MAAAFAAEKPSSITFLSATGSASMAPAAIRSAINAIAIRPLYGARNGSSARRGLRDLDFGLSEEEEAGGEEAVSGLLTELELAQVQLPPHAEIPRETVERMSKGRGPVV